jgi:exopolyphosphatase/guanosine-5'-triphosphate,3'-diphosphate pyrophosphatase
VTAGPRSDHGPVVGASVDLGSNSVHLLVAVVSGHRLQPLVDESVFLGLGDAVDQGGRLGSAARGGLVAALVRYADTARRLGATDITFLGTEPLRRAADAATVVHEVARATGLALHVLSHEEEALLTLIGVMEGRPVTREMVVVDVGGGSSEFVVVGPGRPALAAGLQLGSARLTGRYVDHDPPLLAEIEAMRDAARVALEGAVDASPAEIVAVGGTASNLCKVLPAAILDRTLTRRRIADAVAILATEPSALAAERHLVNPTRARILPAGAAIMDAILERYGLDRIRVSESGIREGGILVVNHAGSGWRDRLETLAHGWRT